jgi:hypothetical protein
MALSVGALPTVVPVHYRIQGNGLVVSSDTQLGAAGRGAVVCLVVDDLDPKTHSGWMVSVTGVANEVAPLPHESRSGAQVCAVDLGIVSGRVIDRGADHLSRPSDPDS